jgi:hypothetical protein
VNEAELQANIATREHIDLVRELLNYMVTKLLDRGELHDRSKLASPESEVFAEYTAKLKGVTYGSEEYKQFLAEMKPALDHHYAWNRHHPECHGEKGIGGMNLIDLLEMFVDWCASCQRHADGNIRKSIDLNQTRFNMDPQLVAIFRNTVEMMRTDGR